MERGKVATLIIVEGDPVYNAPADLAFADRLAKVPLRIHLSLEDNQTSALCQWHVPAAHYLESWSDVLAYDGTVTILQPLIAPLYDGKTAHDLVAALSANPQRSSYDIVKDHWQKHSGKAQADFERWWRKSLHDGLVEGSSYAPKSMTPKLQSQGKGQGQSENPQSLELLLRPDASIRRPLCQ
jgi:molybdopterin-containing oxidoreductase family iron-sulfur binding subunit